MVQLLTNSRMSCARVCLRKHLISYEYGIRPAVDSVPKRIGSAFHRAMEFDALGQDWAEAVRSFGLDAYEEETVLRLVMGHRWRYEAEPMEIVAVEVPFQLPLVNPDTGAETPIWNRAGKIDAIVRLADGRLALLERKTTSDDVEPASDYWTRIRIDQQNIGYFLAARDLGYDVQTIVYDVVRKPTIKPLRATPPESKKYTKDGKLYANQREEDETPTAYGERIREDMAARPEFYFARMEIPRLEQDLELYRHEVWEQQLSLRAAQRSGHWFRSPHSCKTFLGLCEFLNVCSRTDLAENTPDGYVRMSDSHPELSPLEASPAPQRSPEASPASIQ